MKGVPGSGFSRDDATAPCEVASRLKPLPRGLGPALGQGGLGLGQVRGAQVGVECDGALGVPAALGTAALAGQGLRESPTVRRDQCLAPDRLVQGQGLPGQALGRGPVLAVQG